MVVEKNHQVLPTQKAYKVDAKQSPQIAEAVKYEKDDDSPEMDIRGTVLTNDVITTWSEGEPGATIPWHSHSPEMYQVLVNFKGRCKWYYKDNDNQQRSIEGGPGDIIYLPAGAENKVEVVGDEHHVHVGMLKRPRVHRLEHLLGETDGLYDPREFPAAFVFDDMNDRVVRKKESAVSE